MLPEVSPEEKSKLPQEPAGVVKPFSRFCTRMFESSLSIAVLVAALSRPNRRR
jgi:hypothetical protein